MLKEFLLTFILISSTTLPFIKLVDKNFSGSIGTHTNQSFTKQHQLIDVKNKKQSIKKLRTVSSFRPVTPSNLTPSRKGKNVSPNIIDHLIDIKINPNKHNLSNFKFEFYLSDKLITAKDNKFFVSQNSTSSVPVSVMKESSQGDLFIHSDDFSKLQIKLLIPGQNELEKKTHISLDPQKIKALKYQTLIKAVNYQSISFSIDVHGIAVSPHVSFNISYIHTGTGDLINSKIGAFDVYNMDKATRDFWQSTAGVITMAVLVFVVVLAFVIVFAIFCAPLDTTLFSTMSLIAQAFKVAGFVWKSILVPSLLIMGALMGAAYLISGLCTDANLWWQLGPAFGKDTDNESPPQNRDPNAPNYHKYVNWTDNKWVFLPGKHSNYVAWNNHFTKLFNNLLGNHNPYYQSSRNNQINNYFNNFDNDNGHQNSWNGTNQTNKFS